MRFAISDQTPIPALLGSDDSLAEIRGITPSELRELGTSQMVYLRSGSVNGEMAYGIYAADGTVMAVVEDIEVAIELVAERGMTFVAVH